MNFYIYNFPYKNKSSDHNKIYTVVFSPNPQFDLEVFRNEYKKFLDGNQTGDEYIYIGPNIKNNQTTISNLLVGNKIEKFHSLKYGADGIVNIGILPELLILKLREEGLKKIIKDGSGILESDNSFHYILPSGKHSQYFFRLGNVLCHYPQVTFWAFWLLPYVTDKPSKIYYDTSSILSILASLINIKRLFNNQYEIELENFNSYQGLEDTIFADKSLIVISASNSGNIVDRIKYYNESKSLNFIFITLNVEIPKYNFILNLYGTNEILKTKQYGHEKDCEYCKNDSIPVVVSGEQFLPSKSTIKSITIKTSDLPDKTKILLKDFVGKGIIKCNYKDRSKKRELFLDLLDYHTNYCTLESIDNNNSDYYVNRFQQYLENELPINVSYIIHLDDNSSKKIAYQIAYYIESQLNRKPVIHSYKNDLFDSNNKSLDRNSNKVILITASSIATGKKLLQISRDLRDFTQASVHFLVCVLRTETQESAKMLEQNVKWRKNPSKMNKFYSFLTVQMPNNHSEFSLKHNNSPWENETLFLRENNLILNSIATNRIILLNRKFLVDKIFWFNPLDNNSELKIRNNFAFFDFDEKTTSQQVSQADIYFIIACILHNIRNREDNNSVKSLKLEQHEHIRTLLSPNNFLRFNDGIIQSAILRAAKPSELNYSISNKVSHDATNILIDILTSSIKKDSEAILEFLYAIASKKITLTIPDTIRLVERLEKEYSSVQIIEAFLSCIKQSYNLGT